MQKACSFTGHRPMRFGFGYDEEDERCIQLKWVLRQQIELLILSGVRYYYSGFALGVDLWAVEAVLELKQFYPKTWLSAVLPCETQANKWSNEQRERYFNLLAKCDDVVTLQSQYSRDCMYRRNDYLVDHASHLLAVYDGKGDGGTAYTLKKARGKDRQIILIHADSLEVESFNVHQRD